LQVVLVNSLIQGVRPRAGDGVAEYRFFSYCVKTTVEITMSNLLRSRVR